MSKMMDKLMNAVGVDVNKKEAKLMTHKPVKNKSKFRIVKEQILIQADLIYMPDDGNYNYILTVVDVGSRICDAQPLTGRTSQHVIDGFERIFRRKYIKSDQVEYCYTDKGAEFQNSEFHEYMEKQKGITVRHTMTNRKNQMGIVEYYNYLITKVLGVKMGSEELQHKNGQMNWKDVLPKLVKTINENRKDPSKTMKIKEIFADPKIEKNEQWLKQGDLVHVALQQPKDFDGKRLHGKFRHGDQRFEEQTRKIERVLIKPNEQVRYMVEGIKNASFLRSELLCIDEYKQPEPEQKIKVPKNTKKGTLKNKKQNENDENIVVQENKGTKKGKRGNLNLPHMVTD